MQERMVTPFAKLRSKHRSERAAEAGLAIAICASNSNPATRSSRKGFGIFHPLVVVNDVVDVMYTNQTALAGAMDEMPRWPWQAVREHLCLAPLDA